MYFFSRGHDVTHILKLSLGVYSEKWLTEGILGQLSSWSNAHHKFYPNLNLVSSWYLEKCEQYAES